MNNSSFYQVISNSSNNTFFCKFNDSDWSRNLKFFSVFLVGGCGIFGNVFIIILAVKFTVRKNLHHLIINMAVADTLVVLGLICVGLPRMLDYAMWADIKMMSGNTLCRLFTFIVSTSINVSYTSLVIICIERFKASGQTARIAQPYTLKKRLLVVGASWFIPIVLAAFEAKYRTVIERLPGVYVCQGTSHLPIIMRVVYYTMFLSATCCIVVLSIVTLRRISRRQEIEASFTELQRKAREKRIASTVKMVLCSVAVVLCSYLPFIVWNILKLILKNRDAFLCVEVIVFDFLTNFLPLVNSCCSPVIYLMFLVDFRGAAKQLLKRINCALICSTVCQELSREGQESTSPSAMGIIQSRMSTINHTYSQNITTTI